MRLIERISAALLILIASPALIVTWLVLKLRGVRPVLTRSDPRTGKSESGLLFFDARGDDRFSQFLRLTCFDSMPSQFRVAFGPLRYSQLLDWERGARPTRFDGSVRWRGLALVVLAITLVVIAIMWRG